MFGIGEARRGSRVGVGYDESGTGGVLLGNTSLGKAVGVRLGKVVSGIVWRCGLGSVSVRQSGRCKFWHGEFWRVLSGLGSQGFVGHVTAKRGEAGQGTAEQGSRGLARRGEVQYVAANLGMAGHVKAVTARNTNYLERRHNASIYKQVFISQWI